MGYQKRSVAWNGLILLMKSGVMNQSYIFYSLNIMNAEKWGGEISEIFIRCYWKKSHNTDSLILIIHQNFKGLGSFSYQYPQIFALMLLLLTLGRFHTLFWCFYSWLWSSKYLQRLAGAMFYKQPQEVFCKKAVLKNFAMFTGNHSC